MFGRGGGGGGQTKKLSVGEVRIFSGEVHTFIPLEHFNLTQLVLSAHGERLEVDLLFDVYFPVVACYSCQPGVQGDKCTECMDGYKNFSSSGCTPCNCDKNGSLSADCNEFTHQCPCKVSTHTCTCTGVTRHRSVTKRQKMSAFRVLSEKEL